MGGLIAWLLMGLIAGAVARLLVPGQQNLGCIGTSVLGIVGSLVGGTIFSAVADNGFELRTSGFIGAVFGAVVVLVLGRVLSGGGRRQRSDRR